MEKRVGGRFLTPLTMTPLPSTIETTVKPPLGRVDQMRRQFDVQRVAEPVDVVSDQKPPIKGFKLTGTGSMFLKSTSKIITAPSEGGQAKLVATTTTPNSSVKGILRDSSLTDVHVRSRTNESGAESEKSVRFSLFSTAPASGGKDDSGSVNVVQQRPSSALNKNLKLDSDSDDTLTDDDDADEEEEENVVEEVDAVEFPDQVDGSNDDDEDAWTPRPPVEIKVITSAKYPTSPATSAVKPTTGGGKEPENRNKIVDVQQEIRNKKLLEEEMSKFDAELKRIRTRNAAKLQQCIEEEEKALQLKIEARREEMEIEKQHSLTAIESQLEAKLQTVRVEIEESYSLDAFREQLRQEFEFKRMEVVQDHRSAVEVLQKNHAEILADLERDMKLQEELVRKEHAKKKEALISELTHGLESERIKMRESGEERMFEKIRCEKRLLEDKYRCLKDRYNRLKTDVKLSVEKRNNKRKEQQQLLVTAGDKQRGGSVGSNLGVGKNISVGDSQPQNRQQFGEDTHSISVSDTTMSNTMPRNNYSAPLVVDDSDSEAIYLKSETPGQEVGQSDNNDQVEHSPRDKKKLYSRTKSASTSRLHSTRPAANEVPCTPMENLRRQLKKLEDLEDQFPDNTLEATYHLRYPFDLDTATTNYENTSSELEFFKHRIHLERDALSRAKENLKDQRDKFRAKRGVLQQHCPVEVLLGEEKELTEMEVNLHRTRALLGEKVIRLRHLEQSLERFVDHKNDATTLSDISSHSSSGFSSTDFMLSGGGAADLPNKHRRLHNSAGSGESTTDILKNLETLNSEIREIWEILRQTTANNSAAKYYSNELDWSFSATTPHLPLTPNPLQKESGVLLRGAAASGVNRHFTSMLSQSPVAGQYASTLVERTRDLRNWLRQAKEEHLLAQKHTQI